MFCRMTEKRTAAKKNRQKKTMSLRSFANRANFWKLSLCLVRAPACCALRAICDVLPPPRASVGLTQDRTTPPQRQTVPLNMRAAIASSRDAASRVNLGTPRAWRALTLYYEACCRAWSGSNHGAQRTRRKLHADTKTFPCSPPISTCCKISFSTPCSPCPPWLNT